MDPGPWARGPWAWAIGYWPGRPAAPPRARRRASRTPSPTRTARTPPPAAPTFYLQEEAAFVALFLTGGNLLDKTGPGVPGDRSSEEAEEEDEQKKNIQKKPESKT